MAERAARSITRSSRLPIQAGEDVDIATVEQGEGVIYVHRTGGEIDQIRPATRVCLTATRMIVLDGNVRMAVYDRSNVYFAARGDCCPPPPN